MEKIILQITSGRGPQECNWVCAQVLRELIREANLKCLDTKVIDKSDGTITGTVESVFIMIQGNEAKDFCNSWIGTIQWIGQSPYRIFHKRKNWFIGIFEVSTNSSYIINDNDIMYQTMRSSGAGGQNVNKVNSCVRAIHKPTKLQVTAMDTRSQHQNKKLAYERLKDKFVQIHFQQLRNEIDSQWQNQMQIERGNAIRSFEGVKFKLKKIYEID